MPRLVRTRIPTALIGLLLVSAALPLVGALSPNGTGPGRTVDFILARGDPESFSGSPGDVFTIDATLKNYNLTAETFNIVISGDSHYTFPAALPAASLAAATLSAGSTTVTDATSLPSFSIKVASTAGFSKGGYFSDGGRLAIVDPVTSTVKSVVMCGVITPTAFSNCNGGSGTVAVGDLVHEVVPSTQALSFDVTLPSGWYFGDVRLTAIAVSDPNTYRYFDTFFSTPVAVAIELTDSRLSLTGQPITGKVFAKHLDNTPAGGIVVDLQVSSDEFGVAGSSGRVTVGASGVVSFDLGSTPVDHLPGTHIIEGIAFAPGSGKAIVATPDSYRVLT